MYKTVKILFDLIYNVLTNVEKKIKIFNKKAFVNHKETKGVPLNFFGGVWFNQVCRSTKCIFFWFESTDKIESPRNHNK